jgi:anti-sigma-K factor RskA
VERHDVGELSAAYALNALEERDESAYEEHLSRCPECRGELAEFRETAAALAHGVDAALPPPDLRDRILARARAERTNVVTLPRRRALGGMAAAAAVAAAIAVVLGVWVASLASDLDRERQARVAQERAIAVVANPQARRFRVEGGSGVLVVAPAGEAALVLDDLQPPPEGKVYEAWVSTDGAEMLPAGTFAAASGHTVVSLARDVPAGALVAVTLEDAGGADAPTGSPLLTAPTT